MSEACERVFTVRGELGLHARPAGVFVSSAGRFTATIEVARDGDPDWVDGRSILSLLSLAAGTGTRLRIRAEGPDAAEAVAVLGRLLEAAGESQEPAAGGGASV